MERYARHRSRGYAASLDFRNRQTVNDVRQGEAVSAPLCPRCRKHPRPPYHCRPDFQSYCHRCQRERYRLIKAGLLKTNLARNKLHEIADFYRPRDAEDTKTADPMARRSTRKEKQLKEHK